MRPVSVAATVGVIPARGGSKSIPKKALATVGGATLLQHTATAALAATRLGRVVLSTDDPQIAEAGVACGIEVPFLRPTGIATDTTPMIDVLQHALSALEGLGRSVEVLVLLQPTSPMRTATDIDDAVDLLESAQAESVVSVVRVPHNMTPSSLLAMDQTGRVRPWLEQNEPVLRRQDKPALYARNGPAVLAVRADIVRSGQLYGDPTVALEMPVIRSVDIDEPADLELAEALLR